MRFPALVAFTVGYRNLSTIPYRKVPFPTVFRYNFIALKSPFFRLKSQKHEPYRIKYKKRFTVKTNLFQKRELLLDHLKTNSKRKR